jgi:hypothetical protein
MRFSYEVSVDCGDLGRRVTVRFRLHASGLSDVIGILETCDEEAFGIRDRTGTLRRVPRADVVAAKVVAPRPER